MASEVHTAATLGLSKGQHRAVFQNPRGLKYYYMLYVRTSDGVLVYEYSSNGTTWSNTPIAIETTAVDSFDVKIRDNGTDLDVFFVSHTGGTTRYRRGDIADASSTITLQSAQTIDASISDTMAGLHCIAIARTDNGRLVVAFTEDIHDMCKDYRQTKLIGSDGDGASPSWSGETTWDDPTANSNNQNKDDVWFGLENYNSSYPNRILVYAKLPHPGTTTRYSFTTAVPDWNGTVFSNTTQNIIDATADTLGDVISGIVDDSDFGHVVYYVDGTNGLVSRKAGSAGDDNFGSATTVKANAVDACTLTLDTAPATDELYAFYHDAADSTNFHYKVSPVDTISWGSEEDITFASDMIALTSWSRDVESSLHIGLEDADTDVHYHELSLAAPPAGQPVQVRSQGVPTGSGARDRIGRWN